MKNYLLNFLHISSLYGQNKLETNSPFDILTLMPQPGNDLLALRDGRIRRPVICAELSGRCHLVNRGKPLSGICEWR